MPTNPTYTIGGQTVWQYVRNMRTVTRNAKTPSNVQENHPTEPLVEAQGMMLDQNAQVHFVAHTSQLNPATSWEKTSECAQTAVQ